MQQFKVETPKPKEKASRPKNFVFAFIPFVSANPPFQPFFPSPQKTSSIFFRKHTFFEGGGQLDKRADVLLLICRFHDKTRTFVVNGKRGELLLHCILGCSGQSPKSVSSTSGHRQQCLG